MLKNACKHHSNFQVFQTQDKIQSDSIILNSWKRRMIEYWRYCTSSYLFFFWGGGYQAFPIYEALTPTIEDIEAEIGIFFWGDLIQHHHSTLFVNFSRFCTVWNLAIYPKPRLSLLQRCVGQSGNGRKLATHALLRSGGAKDRESKPRLGIIVSGYMGIIVSH